MATSYSSLIRHCEEDRVPLQVAAKIGNLQVTELLLLKGAQVDSSDKYETSYSTVKNAAKSYEQRKKNTVATLQKCINKAKKEKGRVTIRFSKILFTGSGAAGKTCFSNLLMKNKFISFHHSTNIVQAKHAISVKTAVVLGSNEFDESVVWLEMDNDSQISHLREILLSLVLPKTQTNESSTSQLQLPNSGMLEKSTSTLDDTVKNNAELIKPVKRDDSMVPVKNYVSHENLSLGKRAIGWFQKPVKGENLASFNTFVQNCINSDMVKHDICHSGKVLNIITLLDTGGQPEYIHLLPTVNVHPMVTFVVHDLSKSLEDQVLVEYSEHGKLIFEPYHLKYSNFDMIKFLMSSINDSLERKSQVPQMITTPGNSNTSYICCVGTHADKVGSDVIESTDSQLTAMVEKLDCKAAIWQNKDGGILFPVDNTTAGQDSKEDPRAQYIRNKIDSLASGRDVYELPITWMMFELEIRQVCTNNGKAYILFEECCLIAQQSNLISDREEVRNALIYHHLLGVLLYYPEVAGLCDYVIVDHQWLFDRISSIVCYTFRQLNDLRAAKHLKYNGILSNKHLKRLKFKEEMKEDYFIALLVEMNIVAPIERDHDGDDYFIPYILPTYTNELQCNEILSKYGWLQGEPFLIQFMSNLLPRGFFCCLVVEMLQHLPKTWNYQFTQKDTYHTYSNLITFRLQSAYSLSLIDKLSYLEVQIRHQEDSYYETVPIHMEVQDILANAIQSVCEKLAYNHGRLQYGFYCDCGEHKDEHIAFLTRLVPPFDFAWCRYGSFKLTKLEKRHTVWLTEEKGESSTSNNNASLEQSTDESNESSAEYKIFMDYYKTLVDTLPASDLAHYFVSEKIISLDDYDKIIRITLPQEGSKLLLDGVSLQLQNGNSTLFNKMLMIMNHHTITIKILSQEMRRKISALNNTSDDEQTTLCQPNLPSNDPLMQLSSEENLSAEHEIFVHYFSQIVSSISAETLSPFFVQHHIISPPENLEICAALPNRAAGLLLGKVSTALKAGVTEVFYKFLDITEQHGNADSLMVISTIRKKLSLLEYGLKDEGKDDDASEIHSTDSAS